MQYGKVTVGATATQISVSNPSRLTHGMRILGRAANSGNTYFGSTSGVTTATGILVPQGDPATSYPMTIPAEHFHATGGLVYLIADGSGQVFDWSAE